MTESINHVPTDTPLATLGLAKEHRLAGEDAPLWLTAGFGLLGIALALTAVALFTSKSDLVAERMPTPLAAAPAPQSGAASRPHDEAPMTPLLVPISPPASEGRDIAAAPAKEAATETSPTLADCPAVFNIPFVHGSAQPNVGGLEDAAKNLRAWLARNSGAILTVEGHADTTGGERRNILLSFMRAKSVGRWLAGLGIPEGRIVLRGAGVIPSKGVSSAPDENSRRVQLEIEGVPGCR